MSLRKLSGLMLLAIAGTPAAADAQQAFENLEKQLTQPPVAAAAPTEEPGYLGIIADDRETQGRGIRLIDVLASGPAAKAGLQVGDMITSIDGVQVKSLDDMAKVMVGRVVNEEVSFVATRGIEAVRVDVLLTKRPPPEERRFGNFGRIGDPNVSVISPTDPSQVGQPTTVPQDGRIVPGAVPGGASRSIPHPGAPVYGGTPNATLPPAITVAPSVPTVDSLPPPEAIAATAPIVQTPATIMPAAPRGAKTVPPSAHVPTLPPAPPTLTAPLVPQKVVTETVDPDAPLTPVSPLDESTAIPSHVRTGLLGIRTTRITPELQLAMNLPAPRGVLVIEVKPDSPAKAAGIPIDAVIVAAGGRRIDIPDDLAAVVAERGPGADLKLSYYRYGQLYEKTVQLVAPPPVAVARPVIVAEVPTTGPNTLRPSAQQPGPTPAKMEPSAGLPPSTVPPAAVPPSTLPPVSTPAPVAPPFGAGPNLGPSQPTSAGPAVSGTAVVTKTPSTSGPATSESEAAQIRKQIRDLEAQLKALEKRLPPEETK